jgi:hypothetical protein
MPSWVEDGVAVDLRHVDRDLPKSRPIWRNPLVLGLVIGLAIVVGIPLVVFLFIPSQVSQKQRAPEGDIGDLLRQELALTLPAGSSIVQSQRIPAGMDAAGEWEVSIPVASVPPFIEELQATARARGWTISDVSSTSPFVSDAPAWWTPESAGVTRWISLRNASGADAYHFGYSPTSSRCFVYWMTF